MNLVFKNRHFILCFLLSRFTKSYSSLLTEEDEAVLSESFLKNRLFPLQKTVLSETALDRLKSEVDCEPENDEFDYENMDNSSFDDFNLYTRGYYEYMEGEDWEIDSQSVVSESYLEELGLRNSKSSTPSLHSPSPRLIRQRSAPSLSFLSQRTKDVEDFSSSEDDDEDDESVIAGDDSIFKGKIDDGNFLKLDDCLDVEPVESQKIEKKVFTASISSIPDSVLSSIIEYCNDQELLDIRLVNRTFKSSCSSYLKLLSDLTTRPAVESLKEQYSLSTTMMPLFKKQPQINTILGKFFKFVPWHLLNLLDISELKGFKELAIFSDNFIENILVSELELTTSLTQEPPALFLLSEGLLKSKRFELFDRVLLPVLNRISMRIIDNSGLVVPAPQISTGFFEFATEDQKVLGATLHVAITFSLIFTMEHLVKLDPKSIQLKNRFGFSALMLIVENLRSFRGVTIPGPEADENISDWFKSYSDKFDVGQSIQQSFPGNSRLFIEMFLKIVNQIAELLETREDVVNFLGLNDSFTLIRVYGDSLPEKTSTLLHEMISARQYDLIFSLGFYYGDLIQTPSNIHINLLHSAAEMNDPFLTATILKYFVNMKINELSVSGNTALGFAVGANGLNSARILLNDPGIDPNLNKNLTPLIRSIENSNLIDLTRLLINHPAININLSVKYHRRRYSPLSCAVNCRNWEALELLLMKKTNSIDTENMTNLTLLKEAEGILFRAGERYEDLWSLVRRSILPSIQE